MYIYIIYIYIHIYIYIYILYIYIHIHGARWSCKTLPFQWNSENQIKGNRDKCHYQK